jgi:hypothetical protein
MARITTVEKAQKSKRERTCYSCHQSIEVGQSYRWTQPSRYSMRYNWHIDCAMPPGSALETNDKRATAMAAFENLYDNLGSLLTDAENDPDFDLEDAVSSALTDAADEVEQAAEMWRESQQAIEDGFGHATYQSDEMAERADEYDGVAQSLQAIDTTPDDDQPVDEYIERIRDEVSSAEGDLT